MRMSIQSAEPGDTRTLLWREPAAGGGKGGGIQPWARKRGILSVCKHFPGHGDTDVDSHKALPALHYDRARLDRCGTLSLQKWYVPDWGVSW